MEEESQAVVNAILLGVSTAESLDSSWVERIASGLLSRPLWSLTPDEEYRAIVDALNSRRNLNASIGAKLSDNEIRNLLARIVDRLDEARPWPMMPFSILPETVWESFSAVEPMARIKIPWPRIESKLNRTFYRSADGCQYLAVRLRSGAEVAFAWRSGDSVTSIMPADRNPSTSAVIKEIIEATELTAGDFILTQ
ncbi:hypothetical protein [Nocardia araoensis]|uniref:hypothetical protein n=1 Tax=Nocardia araoensis TaxID=228600 RepID=UPI0012F65586|nr:hypothetical protein [Nocardia araoensis]